MVLDMYEELSETKNTAAIWEKYKKEFAELMKDPYEKIANYYFDFLAYLESKTNGKEVGEIIFEKQAANWKK